MGKSTTCVVSSLTSSSSSSSSYMGIGIVMMMMMLVVLVKTVNWVWLKPKKMERFLRQQGLKGNSYNFLFGDFKAFAVAAHQANSKPMHLTLTHDIAPRVLPFFDLILKTYGKDSFIWFGPTPSLNIMNPENIKTVLTNMGDFSKRRENPLTSYLLTGVFTMENQKWAKHRKIINPAFHLEKLKLVLPALYESCKEMIEKWKMMVNEKGSCELDVWPFCDSLSGEVISRTAFGSSFEEGRRVFQLQKEQAIYTEKAVSSLYIPGWRFVPTKMNRRMKEINDEMEVLLRGIIHKREEAMKKGEAPNDDLLGLLLESNYKEIKEHGHKNNMGMNTQEVINECKLFYLAGQETTSVLINWTIVLLSKFSYWQEKAREEVNQVFGSNKLDYDGLNRLKIVTMILYEVLRLYPPGPIMARIVRKDNTKLGNMSLPEGTQIVLPIALIHQDLELWGDDAKEFKPERFSEGILKATKGQTIYIPFGGGPRICMGQHLALLEAKMALCMILQNFSFQLSPSYTHAPFKVLTVQPQFGTHIILQKL